ncbi:hypothetical protein [Flavobacterium silvaticum]|uniref:hypothetical protein n=1 Tax=Flavobacterium silvaticum TaxID=1852020 RepID=UPI001B7D2372|nr:hypothetical protein [Flavobacterium silvaticum]
MTNSEIKNTLFRFVTMRSPELADDRDEIFRFIFIPNDITTTFHHAISADPGKKWTVLKEKASGFEDDSLVLDVAGIKATVSPALYHFAIWLAGNKKSKTASEVANYYGNLTSTQVYDLQILWENLFYQIIMQKDFYAKELLMQLLSALHVIQMIDKDELEIALKATVVLPREIFVDLLESEPAQFRTSFKPGEMVLSNPSATMSKVLKRNESIAFLVRLGTLKKELVKAKAIYWDKYNSALELDRQGYLEDHKTEIENYKAQVKSLKNSYCGVRPEGVAYDPLDPCQKIPLPPDLDIPEFKFTYKAEMDLLNLESMFSRGAYATLLDVLGVERDPDSTQSSIFQQIIQSSITFRPDLTFEDVEQLTDSAARKAADSIIANNPDTSDATAIVGGVRVAKKTQDERPFEFQCCPTNYKSNVNGNTYVHFALEFDVPDTSWEVSAVDTLAVYQNGSEVGRQSYSQIRNGNHITLSNLHEEDLDMGAFYEEIEYIEFSISFGNGAVKSFKSNFYSTLSCMRGMFETQREPYDETETNPTDSQPEGSFIPSGFGVKQLGIADYKKVETSVQGYVEGEVAAIENIMAREYREKATRRLRRSENTITSASESEREKLTDTTSTDRFEMHSEVAKVLAEATDITAGVNANYGTDAYQISANAGFATHSSRDESNMLAVNQAKEITERALDRMVTKVKEERIEKIIEEFEENNKHGYDNTKGDKHVVGVYRWVDKIFKNQILNYGKRLMFEFMVPEPAKLHLLGMEANKSGVVLQKPADPRTFEDLPNTPPDALLQLKDFNSITDSNLKYWAGKYNAEIPAQPTAELSAGASFKILYDESAVTFGSIEANAGQGSIKVPEGYEAYYASGVFSAVSDNGSGGGILLSLSIGNVTNKYESTFFAEQLFVNDYIIPYQVEVPVSFTLGNHVAGDITASVKCRPTPETMNKWRLESFKAVIDAYEDALSKYEQKMAEAEAKEGAIKEANPGFYRQIENMILRKNCISYLIDQNPAATSTYGKDMFKPLNPGETRNFGNHEVNVTTVLDKYAALSKFMEQAFEWDIMSYNFYPYYWGRREDWGALYQYDNNDPLFRSFMQAGTARVIVTVRPGFEDAVRYYLQTGQIWNGGEVPLIEDKLFMAITKELTLPVGVKEGKAWPTRLPTSLTILQADSIGLKVSKALPFNEDDLEDFEDPEAVPQSESFEISEAQLGNQGYAKIIGHIEGNQGKEIKVVLKRLDHVIQDLTYSTPDGNWELNTIPIGNYELFIDANDDLPTDAYEVVSGSRAIGVQLHADQVLEANLEVQHVAP